MTNSSQAIVFEPTRSRSKTNRPTHPPKILSLWRSPKPVPPRGPLVAPTSIDGRQCCVSSLHLHIESALVGRSRISRWCSFASQYNVRWCGVPPSPAPFLRKGMSRTRLVACKASFPSYSGRGGIKNEHWHWHYDISDSAISCRAGPWPWCSRRERDALSLGAPLSSHFI